MTLKSNARKQKQNYAEISYEPNYKKLNTFTDAEEADLAKYLAIISKLYHCLTPKNARTLAYQFANRNNKTNPKKWNVKQETSYDWFWGFMSRYKELSLKKPEATSLSRATSFNRHNVKVFMKI